MIEFEINHPFQQQSLMTKWYRGLKGLVEPIVRDYSLHKHKQGEGKMDNPLIFNFLSSTFVPEIVIAVFRCVKLVETDLMLSFLEMTRK